MSHPAEPHEFDKYFGSGYSSSRNNEKLNCAC